MAGGDGGQGGGAGGGSGGRNGGRNGGGGVLVCVVASVAEHGGEHAAAVEPRLFQDLQRTASCRICLVIRIVIRRVALRIGLEPLP